MKSFFALALIAAVATTQARQSTVPASMNPNSPYNRLYLPKSPVTVSGRVVGLTDVQSPSEGMAQIMSLIVRSPNGGSSSVDLGPTWFLKHQKVRIRMNDFVKVTGSKVALGGRSFVIARKVTKGNSVLYLREVGGFPLWIATRGHIAVTSTRPTVARAPVDHSPLIPPLLVPNPNLSTIQGYVRDMTTVPDGQSGAPITVLELQTDKGLIRVELGPQWYFEHQTMPFELGNTILIRGTNATQVAASTSPLFVAYDLTYGSQIMILRPPSGIPVWNAWGGG